MKLKNKILLLAVVLWVVAGCTVAPPFIVEETGTPTMNGLRSLHGTATVTNLRKADIMVESATFTVRYRGRELGSARLLLPIELPGGARTAIRYDFALEGVSPASLQTLQSRLFVNPGAFSADLKGWVRWGCLRKKVEIEWTELSEVTGIISNFAQ